MDSERLRTAIAVLRGRQAWPNGYPTPWAYEKACEALWRHRAALESIRSHALDAEPSGLRGFVLGRTGYLNRNPKEKV